MGISDSSMCDVDWSDESSSTDDDDFEDPCSTCPPSWIGDGVCDQSCLDRGCFDNDGDDCVVSTTSSTTSSTTAAPFDCTHCSESWIGDGVCDQSCLDQGCFEHDADDC